MDMRSSFDSRDDRHAYVGYVFQNLSAFVVILAPNTGIGNIAKRVPIDPNNEVAFCISSRSAHGQPMAAARALAVGHVTVGRRIALFEKRLGVTLLNRTP